MYVELARGTSPLSRPGLASGRRHYTAGHTEESIRILRFQASSNPTGTETKWAGIDSNQTVLIMCASATPHEKLVEILDTCTSVGLSNLSVVSSGD